LIAAASWVAWLRLIGALDDALALGAALDVEAPLAFDEPLGGDAFPPLLPLHAVAASANASSPTGTAPAR
jgi:hypothetical protein